MATDEIDVDRYLERIGYSGSREPTVATLNALAAHHARNIPFENLDPFLGKPNKLDLASLQGKMVESRRGGYCFEQNLLLRAVLLKLGYTVTALAGRVLWNAPLDAITPRGHMLLLVAVEGERRIIDVGFGGMTLTGTLRLELDTEQPTPLEPFRLSSIDGDYAVQAKINGQWYTTYRFDLQPQHPVDYEAANWYLSTFPDSHFVTGLTAARATEDRRYALSGMTLKVHHLADGTEQRELTSAHQLRQSLEEDFRIDTSTLPDLDAAVTRLQ